MGKIAAEAGSVLKDVTKRKSWSPTEKRFVCFLDIMGFKDMVMRNPHDKIFEMLTELSKHREEIENSNLPKKYDSDSLKTVSFSDTIVVFTKQDSIECLELLTLSVSWLFAKAMSMGIPMKGAISHGEMSVNISRQIFFGQPLIDAYLLEEDVAFYGIVIHNTLEEFINNRALKPLISSKYIDCLIPLKSGKINHLILDWVQALETDVDDEQKLSVKEIAINLMKKQRERTSGSPRKYIDNTVEVINTIIK